MLNIDLASTFAELGRASIGLPQDGRSLVPLLHPRADPRWRHAFVVEYLGDEFANSTPPDFEAIRTERYLYVRYANGWRELYDLRTDPYELWNLTDPAADAGVEHRLSRRLDVLLARPPRPTS